jgi:hypothetical protein
MSRVLYQAELLRRYFKNDLLYYHDFTEMQAVKILLRDKPFFPHNRRIHGIRIIAHGLYGVPAYKRISGLAAHFMPCGGILQKKNQFPCHILHTVRRDKKSALSVINDFGDASGVSGNDGLCGKHRFQRRNRQTFPQRSKHEHVECRNSPPYILAPPCEDNRRIQLVPPDKLFNFLTQYSVPDKDELYLGHLLTDQRGKPDKILRAFLRFQTSDHSYKRLTVIYSELIPKAAVPAVTCLFLNTVTDKLILGVRTNTPLEPFTLIAERNYDEFIGKTRGEPLKPDTKPAARGGLVFVKTPAVHCMDNPFYPGYGCRPPAQNTRLRAVRMDKPDIVLPDKAAQLDARAKIRKGAQRPIQERRPMHMNIFDRQRFFHQQSLAAGKKKNIVPASIQTAKQGKKLLLRSS